MKRNLSFPLLALLFLWVAVTPTTWALTGEQNKVIEAICKYDDRCASTKANINPTAVAQLKLAREAIWQAARLYQVPASAIAGAILAEHSMNTSLEDVVQDELVKSGAAPTGNFLGRTFSYGFGQLYTAAAEDVEPHCAEKEQRPRRSPVQIARAILTPEGSIFYVAAILSKAKKLYAEKNIDIGTHLGILTTLYNIGKIESRLERTLKEGRLPQPNYFGGFVIIHQKEIEELLGAAPTIAPAVVASVESPPPADPSRATTTLKLAEPAPEAAPTSSLKEVLAGPPKSEWYRLNKDVELASAPPVCLGLETGSEVPPLLKRTLQRGARLTRLESQVDCDFKGWALVQDSSGKSGWIEERKLLAFSNVEWVEPSNCTTAVQRECQESVRKQLNPFFASNRLQEPVQELSLFKRYFAEASNNIERGLSEDIETLLERPLLDEFRRRGWGEPETADETQARELKALILDFKTRVAKDLKLDALGARPGGLSNPYQAVLEPVFEELESCMESSPCAIDLVAWKEWLKDAPTHKESASLSELFPGHLASRLLFKSNSKENIQFAAANLRHLLRSEITRPLSACYKAIQGRPDSQLALEEMIAKIRSTISETVRVNALKSQEVILDPNWIEQLKSSLSGTFEFCQGIAKETQDTSVLPQASCVMNNDLNVLDGYLPQLKKVAPYLVNHRQSSRDRSLARQLKASMSDLAVQFVENESDRQIYTLRALADAVADQSCVQTVYVPYPWLASKPNQVVRKVNNAPSRIWVDFGQPACQK